MSFLVDVYVQNIFQKFQFSMISKLDWILMIVILSINISVVKYLRFVLNCMNVQVKKSLTRVCDITVDSISNDNIEIYFEFHRSPQWAEKVSYNTFMGGGEENAKTHSVVFYIFLLFFFGIQRCDFMIYNMKLTILLSKCCISVPCMYCQKVLKI